EQLVAQSALAALEAFTVVAAPSHVFVHSLLVATVWVVAEEQLALAEQSEALVAAFTVVAAAPSQGVAHSLLV
ncbi:MAG: hypothetical protein RLO02_02320, partial [Roseitalea porphyridii]